MIPRGNPAATTRDVRLARKVPEVAGAGVAQGHCGIGSGRLVPQQDGYGPPNERAAADYDHVLAFYLDPAAAEDLQDPVRRTGPEALLLPHEAAQIDRVQAIDILVWVNGVEDLLLVLARQR